MSDFLQSDVGFSVQSAVGVLVVAVVALVAVSALAARDTPDPQGTRARALYLTSVSLVALVVALVAGFGTLRPAFAALIEEDEATFAEDESDFGEFGEDDIGFEVGGPDADDDRWAATVSNGFVLLAAVGVLLAHRRRLDEVGVRVLERQAPERHTYVAYLYLVAFITALVALFAFASAGFDVYRLVAPDVTGIDEDVERKAAIAHLLAVGALGVAAALLWRDSWGEAEALTGYELSEEAAVTPPAGPSDSGSASPPS